MTLRPITIIGGGLAGLVLGIALRRRGIPVKILEAGHYPRHRVCGEFISGSGQKVLSGLGLSQGLLDAGAVPARTAQFSVPRVQSPVRALPSPALSVSRFVLDRFLAEQFCALGGVLRTGERCRESAVREGFVRANGRRQQSTAAGWRWFGLKAHARNVAFVADVEMHAFRHGYVGLTRLKDEVNVCGLFRRKNGETEPALGWQALLRGPPGSVLRQRLECAVFDEDSFCSVAGLSLDPHRAEERAECSIGDALTMTPPVTGNGMSMALEAASLAAGPLAAYSRAELSWPAAQQTIARLCDRAFATRLKWARWLQQMMFTPAFQGCLGVLPLRSEWLWRLMFRNTR